MSEKDAKNNTIAQNCKDLEVLCLMPLAAYLEVMK